METQTLIIIAVITVILWFAFRPVFLWYWKINNMESLLQEQLDFLKQSHKETIEKLKLLERVEESNLEGVVFSIPESLEYDDKRIIKLMAQTLKRGQLISIHNISNELKIWSIPEYHADRKRANNNALSIVAIKE